MEVSKLPLKTKNHESLHSIDKMIVSELSYRFRSWFQFVILIKIRFSLFIHALQLGMLFK